MGFTVLTNQLVIGCILNMLDLTNALYIFDLKPSIPKVEDILNFLYTLFLLCVWFWSKEALGWDKVPRNMQYVSKHWIPLG